MEEATKNKEAAKVQLLLEELRTEGLALQPTTGSCPPPLVFLRAAVGPCDAFTAFTSTSATRATLDALVMNVSNMYTETLLLQIWSVPAAVDLPAAAPRMDVLTRLISLAKERTNPAYPFRVNKEAAVPSEATQRPTPAIVVDSGSVEQPHDTPTLDVSVCENGSHQEDAAALHDAMETSVPVPEGGGTGSEDRDRASERERSPDTDVDEAEVPMESPRSSPESQVTTSTPKGKGRSDSFQDLELSSVSDEGTHRPLEKSKSNMDSLKKFSVSNFRASFRSNKHKNKQNGVASPGKDKSFDTASLRSDSSDINPYEKERAHTGLSYDDDCDSDSHRLNREKSRSTLSITSFTRNLSLRLSSKKASQAIRRIGNKKNKVSRSETSTPEPSRRLLQLPLSADTSPQSTHNSTDHLDTSPLPSTRAATPPSEDSLNLTPYSRKSIRNMFKPRSLRTFRGLGDSSAKPPTKPEKSDGIDYFHDKEDSVPHDSRQAPQNPTEIQGYLSSQGKAHLKAELLASATIPIKSLAGKWRKEGWFPLTKVKRESVSGQKKKKGARGEEEGTRNKTACRCHVRLTLPSPETELATSGYDTYYTTLRKLVHAHLSTMHGSIADYRGEVSLVGDVLLEQLIFFSRVSEQQKSLAKWLILAEVKSGDPGILLPLLRAIKTHLEAGIYLTAQKRQLGLALVAWVRKVLSDEFEMLHSSFPRRDGLLELARLEDFLRCFNTVETCYELRVLFEREAAPQGLTAISDLLQDVLVKHADTWVEALSKEKLQSEACGGGGDSDGESVNTSSDVKAWGVWQASLRRASILTKPVLDFLFISFHTYQPIFMLELSVDYMYLVMPRMLKAAAHLLNPLLRFDVDGTFHYIAAKDLAAAAQATWLLITNLSKVNKIGIDSRLPQHLILPAYRDAFSEMMHHWLVLSKHLALQEFHKDIQEDQLVALDHAQGYSQAAVGVADLMKAMRKRMCGVHWPGGVGPGITTLHTMAQQMMELAAHYAQEVTHAYITTATQPNNIPTEVCVVVRNVEHVCDEVRKHLLHLATLAGEAQEAVHQLQDRTTHLQEHVEDAAEALLRQCLPNLEKFVTRAIREGDAQQIVKTLQEAVQPVQDRLYFAEPLLHQLWYRLVDHGEQLKTFYVQGDHREDLRRLGAVMQNSHDFLTDMDGIGLTLLEEVTKKYEAIQAELKLLGATSAELMSQFYHMRHQDQQREDSTAGRLLVFNAMFTKDGLRVHVVQAPGSPSAASLVKVRLEPFQWFPNVEPLKTHLVKGDPAVFDQVLEFPGVLRDCEEGGGVVTLQVRSPRLLSSAVVHDETLLPLADLPSVTQAEMFNLAHLRLPLTRPWDFKSYKPLEALMARSQDKSAVEFLKTLSERWKSGDGSDIISDNSKLLSSFARAGSVRSIKNASRKHARRGTVKS
ncbi:Protein unc-13 4B [Chionoecetes opilio]|uniref:Protein unc-13 4B n=1 Tax=Chionoecetes opilio TaxID=41210 RepID=A0A8J4Y399_CHIOP|nr:Protein unc-13 4B [Chionoecetes opilio]